MKTCTKCKRAYVASLAHFRRDRTTPSGLTRHCKMCLLEKDARTRAAIKADPARRARAIEMNKAWIARNLKKFKKWQRQYVREYKRNHPEVQKRYRARRIAKKIKEALG